MRKIDESVLLALEDVGLTREEALETADEKIKEGLEKGVLTEEDLEYLGSPLSLSVEPLTGSINTQFTFTVSGANPGREVWINIKKGVTKTLDPVVCKIPKGGTSCKADGATLTRLAKGILPSVSAAAKVTVYAREKSWWIDRKSNEVILSISKEAPLVGGVFTGVPGMQHGASMADFMPAPPPYPPLPKAILRALGIYKG